MKWFYQQSRRDQIALLICGICVALYLVWFVGIKPLASANDEAQKRYVAMAESLARVKVLATTLKFHQSQADSKPSSQQVSIEQIISGSSRENQLQFATLNPSRNGEEATVRFDNAPLANLVAWVHQLETQYNAQIEDLNLTAATQPGQVMATLRIRKG